ncbi:MAG: outer membrane lipoprotein carrier protein LolA [Saprospiraceae bacterium]|nr:outer membrane lipoprotein carrier protein LolA [Saprospiraceae bacterium]
MHYKFLLLTGLFFVSAIGFAQEGFRKMKDVEGFKQKLNNITKVTETIQCSFVQEKQLSFMKEKMIAKGLFYFDKKNRLRWEYNSPYKYTILLNDKQLTVVDNGKVSKIDAGKNDTFQKIQGMLTRTLQGNVLDGNDKFSYELFENDQQALVKLTPVDKEIKGYISGIDLYFDKKDLMMARIDMHEAGDLTSIKFTNRKVNEPLPAGAFSAK